MSEAGVRYGEKKLITGWKTRSISSEMGRRWIHTVRWVEDGSTQAPETLCTSRTSPSGQWDGAQEPSLAGT